MSNRHYNLAIPSSNATAGAVRFVDFDWNNEHDYVRLPCSAHDVVNGRKKWDIVRHYFEECQIVDFESLCDAMCEYNLEVDHGRGNFIDKLNQSLEKHFFDILLPFIGKLALRLPYLFDKIPLLQSDRSIAVTMSQEQASCLLANAFLCTFPTQSRRKNSPGAANHKWRGGDYPDFSFVGLFTRPVASNVEKLKCLIHYFDRVFVRDQVRQKDAKLGATPDLNSRITFERRVLRKKLEWNVSESLFGKLYVESETAIEDSVSAAFMQHAFSQNEAVSPAKSSPNRKRTANSNSNSNSNSPSKQPTNVVSTSLGSPSSFAAQPDFCAWQADFANKYIGGGVLNSGCVQEEILFVIYPECLVSLLFTQVLGANEALLIRGAQRFKNYTGYAHNFRCTTDYFDSAVEEHHYYMQNSELADQPTKHRALRNLPSRNKQLTSGGSRNEVKFDQLGRRNTLIFAVDAIPFGRRSSDQFSPFFVKRELNKFYAAICRHQDLGSANSANQTPSSSQETGETSRGSQTRERPRDLSPASAAEDWLESSDPIVTGNWGCGAFGGDKQLKALIQLCAAAECGRPVVYCTFRERSFGDQLRQVHNELTRRKVTVRQLLGIIEDFYNSSRDDALFDYVLAKLPSL